jgi:DNA-binding IclR family transcriptional regulator
MNATNRLEATEAPNHEHAAMLVLRALSVAQADGRRVGLEELAAELGLRRAELRSMLSALHRQGLVDVLRMRPTLSGFAMGRSLECLAIAPLRRRARAPIDATRAA